MASSLSSIKSSLAAVTKGVKGLQTAGKGLPVDPFKFTRDTIAKGVPGATAEVNKQLNKISNKLNPLSKTAGDEDPTSTTSGKNRIKQTERLLTVRPRSAAFPDNAGGDRGTRARIRLVSTDIEKSRQARATSGLSTVVGNNDLARAFNKLTDTNPGTGYDDFLLTSVSVSFNEKVQITPTFGDTETVYYFGKQPVIFNLSGILIDDVDNQWFNSFVEMYGAIIRGTESARNFELIELILPNMIVTGTIMSLGYSQDATRDTDIPFNMTMHAKTAVPIPVQVPSQMPTNAARQIDWKRAETFTSFADINKVKSEINPFSEDIQFLPSPMELLTHVTGFGARLPRGITGSKTTSAGVFGSSIFSPVFGVLTSITKVVKDVTGNIASIISSLTNPVLGILRDVRNIATVAVGVATAITKGVDKILNGPLQILTQLRNTIVALKNALGVITRVPRTISQNFRQLTNFGRISTSAAFLTGGGKPGKSKVALLGSGRPYDPVTSGTF